MWLCGPTGPSNEPDFYLRLYTVLCPGLCLHGVEGVLMDPVIVIAAAIIIAVEIYIRLL